MNPEFLAKLTAAQTDDERSWLVTELRLGTLSEELRSMVWAAVIPHWFDADILAALRPMLASQAVDLYSEIQGLSFIEQFGDRGHRVHDLTRRLMLDRLWTAEKSQFKLLSHRAANYFERKSEVEVDKIEWIYHYIVSDPVRGANAIKSLADSLLNEFRRPEYELLIKTIKEQLDTGRSARRINLELMAVNAKLHFLFGKLGIAGKPRIITYRPKKLGNTQTDGQRWVTRWRVPVKPKEESKVSRQQESQDENKLFSQYPISNPIIRDIPDYGDSLRITERNTTVGIIAIGDDFFSPQHISLQVTSDLESMESVSIWFEQVRPPAISEVTWLQCRIALAEGFSNAVRHAHRDTPIDLRADRFDDRLEMRIWDRGVGFDLLAYIAGLPRQIRVDNEGGRGLRLLQDVADRLSYDRDGDCNCLTIVKWLA
jgi:anti-sigma regulatory factor (Ser/Thr protein kinase)